MTASQDFVARLQRLRSGVPGLDRVLAGGFFEGGVYIIEGAPGAGKTILANQVCFHHAREGRRVLYVTLLAESHARLLQHLQTLSFFEPSVLPSHLTYISAFRELEAGGLRGLLDLVSTQLRAKDANLVVVDGFAAVGESAENDREFKKFVQELQVRAALTPCTFFLLSSGIGGGSDGVQPVHTMVDGLLRLSEHLFGLRAQRELYVAKFRGSPYLRGVHSFEISDQGIHVHPRLESLGGEQSDLGAMDRVPTGLASLDQLMGGGFVRASTTMLLGPTGVGKTVLGYQFVAASNRASKGLLVSFYETAERAVAKAGAIGLDLGGARARGDLQILWQSPVESSLDAIGHRILDAVDRAGVKRLFIDGFGGFEYAAVYPTRVPQFFAALQCELHRRDVTSLYASELRPIFAPAIQSPVKGLSPLLENLLLLRFVEVRGRVDRVISVIKMRDSSFDTAIRAYRVDAKGIHIGKDFRSSEAVLTGIPREPASKAAVPHRKARAPRPKRRPSPKRRQ